jgi:hypothetical protein
MDDHPRHDRDDLGESHLQERDDFEKTIDRDDPKRVGRADRPPTRAGEGEDVGDHADPRVVQPGETPPPESRRR